MYLKSESELVSKLLKEWRHVMCQTPLPTYDMQLESQTFLSVLLKFKLLRELREILSFSLFYFTQFPEKNAVFY